VAAPQHRLGLQPIVDRDGLVCQHTQVKFAKPLLDRCVRYSQAGVGNLDQLIGAAADGQLGHVEDRLPITGTARDATDAPCA
jgi:hypothetical protein